MLATASTTTTKHHFDQEIEMADQGVEYSEQHDDGSGFTPKERVQKFEVYEGLFNID